MRHCNNDSVLHARMRWKNQSTFWSVGSEWKCSKEPLLSCHETRTIQSDSNLRCSTGPWRLISWTQRYSLRLGMWWWTAFDCRCSTRCQGRRHRIWCSICGEGGSCNQRLEAVGFGHRELQWCFCYRFAACFKNLCLFGAWWIAETRAFLESSTGTRDTNC